jgi:hypothetical protein
LLHDFVLEGKHLPVVGLVVVAAQVQHAVHHGLAQVVAVLGTDHDVPQLSRAQRRSGFIDGEGEHVCGLVACSVLAVEPADAPGVDERNGQVALLDAGRCRGGKRGCAQLGRRVDEIELDDQTCWRIGGRRAGACCSAYSL